eukprot:TRINITY_DN1258_c0_g1_i1.p1 TRINITY_DN1258_c0_g1~~TRINITY_DN1258_c0_g1_i1.p1  ORF type:complete len:254 (-),score=68.98 TRINITY_DN1258_c0_g1_i1:73-834(-)
MSAEEKVRLAEKYKMEGNNRLAEKQYAKAVESYTRAINIDSTNAIYYSNRAAANSHLGKHQEAINDCQASIALKPDYSKPYGRMGLAYFSLGKYKEACDYYKKALEFEPNSASLKESLAAAEKKLKDATGGDQTQGGSPVDPAAASQPGFMNNPMFANMMNMFGGGAGPAPGSVPGSAPGSAPPMNFNDLLNNPMISNMAAQMMNNPAMMNMAQNLMRDPAALNNMMRTLGVDPSALNDANMDEDMPPSGENQ